MFVLQPLVARDLVKAYGDRAVLTGVDVVATPGQPLGLVGENGVGKSTLLRLLAGVEAADAGEVRSPADVGYVAQELRFRATATVAEVLTEALAPLHAAVRRLESLAFHLDDPSCADDYATTLSWAEHHGAWDADRRAKLASARLGLESIEADRRVAAMSGGERTRLALAAVVTRRPECVLVDEPTNHLDDQAIAFLEDFLVDLPGVVVAASHDRVFLDRVCASIVDLDDSHFGVDGAGGNRFGGGFSTYLAHKQAARRRWDQAFLDQQAELNELRAATRTTARQVAHNRAPRDNDKFIYHFKGANVQATIRRRVRNAEQRIAVIERELVPKPPAPLTFDQPLTSCATSDGLVVFIRDLRVERRVSLARLDLSAGQRLLVTGTNGSGKSTLLGVIRGRVTPDSGVVRVSAQRVGLLEQDVRFARPELTARQTYDAATDSPGQLSRTPLSPIPLGELGLLHSRDLDRPVGVLSVGQQRRLALTILVARRPDVLLLDEPTNHISLALASELEEALAHSMGTVIIASHDRWLRRNWTGETLPLTDQINGRSCGS
ncbi:MAG: ABC-F family ATP-binding cassette domain-containing protein [Nocardioidaceae bacterium]